MTGLGDAVKYLYANFLLRDILSFVMPGAAIVWVTLYRFFPQLLDQNFHWLLYIPIFGLFYVTGFAVECLERLSGSVHLHTLDDATFKERLSIFCRCWRKREDIYKEFRERAFEFLWASSDHDWAKQNYERLVVLKQMCANNFGAVIIAGILFGVSFSPYGWVKMGILSLVILVLLVSLFWGYRDFTIEVTTLENKFKSLRQQDLGVDK
ncbi:MAG: hypothetical protein HYX84_03150 [Chloroflexi bacterium]|nr:hypothetical protein [Chloroflexota bacterium]